ncbi:MAG: STAS domain-containing protein [bacterium]|nr:STAS domain-containing protein [bacterium]
MSNVEVIQGKWRIIRPAGEIDFSNVGELDAALDTAAGESPEGFVIDLSGVTYFDSAGVRAILYALKRVHAAGGKLALVVQTYNVHELLEALNLEHIPGIVICDSVDAAEQTLSAG